MSKALLAKAVAEAKFHSSPISGCEFVEMFVGMGGCKLEIYLNKLTKSTLHSIIDEIDTIGKLIDSGMPK